MDGTSASDFRFADLEERSGTVFLCLLPDRLDTYARWLRLLVGHAVTDMARSPARPASPVLFLLDEFAALGRLEPVERRALYGERAGTFLSNAGVVRSRRRGQRSCDRRHALAYDQLHHHRT